MAEYKVCKVADVNCGGFSNGFCWSSSPCAACANMNTGDKFYHQDMSFVLLRYLGNVLKNQQEMKRRQDRIEKLLLDLEKHR